MTPTRALHPDPALRVLRNELVRLQGTREALHEALGDPKIPWGLAKEQLGQTDYELMTLGLALEILEEAWDAALAKKAAA